MKLLSLIIEGTPIQAPPGVPIGGFSTGLGNTILGNLMNAAFVIAVVVALIYLIWAGILWISSGGDKEKIAAARKRLMYSVLGLIVIFLSIFIVNMILFFFGRSSFGIGKTTTAPVEGKANYGCFYGLTKKDGTPVRERTCFTPPNATDPTTPRENLWFTADTDDEANANCSAYCSKLPELPPQ